MIEKLKKIASTLFYSSVLYFLTFIFVAFFTLSAQALREWKQSEMVRVSDDHVEISGNNMLSRKEVILLSGLESGKSWFDLDERRMEAYLLSSGWVKRAFVTKLFPDSLKIVLEEFVPAIVVNSRRSGSSPNEKKDVSTLWFADSEGIVFKRTFPGETTALLPFFHIDNDAI
ncbi:MAG TPA: FtsQ-type POTRA domain-containing protein, partial [bacterium]|nr:FtsQ-type POTRA domain-containing protein [bacterium]